MLKIGIDVGGTFTDLVAVDDTGHSTLAKVASTPQDPSIGVMAGLDRLAEILRCRRAQLLAQTERIVHGTTVATNALLEHKGAKVGLLTTEGHRDVIEMREGLKDDRYNLRMPPPVQLVPRALRLGVTERMRADGAIETPLDRASLDAAIEALKRAGVEAVAVCYLHAYRDPRHERETAAALAEAMPDAYVSLSSEVFPQIKEFDRVSTTVVNAYVGPALSRYLRRLEQRLVEAGYRGPILIIQSHGGVAPIAESARLAAGGVLSGPAGGVAGSRYATQAAGQRQPDPVRYGRHQHGYLPDRRWRAGAGQRARHRRPSAGAEQPRHRQPRRRWRLDRPRRCRRHPACRSGERRRDARAGLLRARRQRTDGDRCQSGARAISIPRISLAAASRSMPLPRRPRWTGWRRR